MEEIIKLIIVIIASYISARTISKASSERNWTMFSEGVIYLCLAIAVVYGL